MVKAKTDEKVEESADEELQVIGSPKSGPAPEAAAHKNGSVADPPAPDQFEIDLAHWKTRDLMNWQRLAVRGVIEDLITMAMPTIRKWPYEGDPLDIEAWEVLPPAYAWAVCKAVGSEVANFFR